MLEGRGEAAMVKQRKKGHGGRRRRRWLRGSCGGDLHQRGEQRRWLGRGSEVREGKGRTRRRWTEAGEGGRRSASVEAGDNHDDEKRRKKGREMGWQSSGSRRRRGDGRGGTVVGLTSPERRATTVLDGDKEMRRERKMVEPERGRGNRGGAAVCRRWRSRCWRSAAEVGQRQGGTVGGDEKRKEAGAVVMALDGDTGDGEEESLAVAEGLGGRGGEEDDGSVRSRCCAAPCAVACTRALRAARGRSRARGPVGPLRRYKKRV